MRTSKATATWEGGLKSGGGKFTAESEAFGGAYSFPTRFEQAPGTNPEELLAAAHAACFSMALAAGLERGGNPPASITTEASCTIDVLDAGPKVTTMQLVVRGSVPGIDAAAFQAAAEAAKDGCPISGAIAGNVAIELEATLEG